MYCTVTVLALTADSVTGNDMFTDAELPSVTAPAAATDTVGSASSSSMVPMAELVPSVALAGSDSCTLNVSSCSSTLSAVVCTSKVALVAPAAIVTVSLVVTAV